MKKRELKRITIRLESEVYKKLENLAKKNNNSISSEVRISLNEHLKIASMEDTVDETVEIIHEAMKVHIDKLANRLAALFNRNTIIAAAAYFTNLGILSELVGLGDESIYRELEQGARKQALEFANTKSDDVLGAFISDKALDKALKSMRIDKD